MTSFKLGPHYLDAALFLAHASYAAYEDDPKDYEFQDFQFQDFQFDELIPFARGFLAEREDAIILAFRGTDDPWDWLINVNIFQDDDDGARVHSGFKHALKSVWPQISEPLQKMHRQKKRKIWVTGHSLGGALATLATRRLIRNKNGLMLNKNANQIETHTFGQPRVGCARMARQIISPFYRFAYSTDLVTYFPVGVFNRVRYAHAGTLKYIDKEGDIHRGTPNLFSSIIAGYRTARKLKGELVANDELRTTVRAIERTIKKDHEMPHYIAKIAQEIENG